jgi:oxalate decarboxylase/phosphoglucose isomerase-like protein (cupin superfamily)|tara:strand:- start:81 stop:485 length:405 start_codon:yes stop_codon:yes gene_type:complete
MFNKFKILNYNRFSEKSGTLIPFYSDKSFPKNFIIKRFFILYGKKGFPRADHAHKKTTQIIIPIKGKIKLTIFYNNKKKVIVLEANKNKALYIPPYHWLKINFKNNSDSLLTLCNYKYLKKEYILDFNDFKKIK